MATIQKRKSRGNTYWYIVESRRVNGKPRPITLAYLGTAADLLRRLSDKSRFQSKSFSHGDTAALVEIARELDVIGIINKHVPPGSGGDKPIRDGLTVGGSLLLSAIGRACHPTSKLGWYDWCKQTSLEYCLRSSLRKLGSQHFWDQMNALPEDKIALIETELVDKMVRLYGVKPDCLFFDTTNFFTFIDSANEHCDLPQRGKNKQKRNDLRQFGVALLVTRQHQFPIFHKTYEGNSNDITVFKNNFKSLTQRLRDVFHDLAEVTIVFDKGNNSRGNFAMIDSEADMHYVGSLVPSYFKDLIQEANEHFQSVRINGEQTPAYRVKKEVWGKERTCVVTISTQLKEGQLQGIHQHLKRKYKSLDEFKAQLESPKRQKTFSKDEIKTRLTNIIKGQFIDAILKYDFIELKNGSLSFTYHIDEQEFEKLKAEILGRKITVTNRHEWTSEEIILAYRGQTKVEYAFRKLKYPFHFAIRPQFHWTDQKIEVHVHICLIGYLLTVAAYAKAQKAGYRRNIANFLEDLKTIRLASYIEQKEQGRRGKFKVTYALEHMDPNLSAVATALGISNTNLRPSLAYSVYN
jgi:transposase